MCNFKDYYKFPLKPMLGLELVKVLTDDNQMAFDWCQKLSIDYINCFIRDINGFKVKEKYEGMESVYKDGIVYLKYPDLSLLRIRGWGMLTDHPYHLSEEKAKEIQDAFGNYIVKQLNSH